MFERLSRYGETCRHTFRQQTLLVAVTGVLIAATVWATAYFVLFLKQSALSTAEEHTRNLAVVISEQTSRALSAIDLVASGVVHELQAATGEQNLVARATDPEFKARLRDLIAGLPDLDNIAVVSSQGRLLSRTRPGPIPPVDLSKRDYLTELRNAPPYATYLSNPTRSPTTGTWEVALASRVTSPEGSFLGVVIGVMELHNFEDFYAKVALGTHGSISLTRQDGIHLARFPHVDAQVGKSLKASIQNLVLNNVGGVVRQVSPLDGVDRIVAAQQVKGFPVVSVISMAVDDVLTQWRRQAWLISGMGVLACAVLIIGAAILARRVDEMVRTRSELGSLRERERAQKEMAVQLERFDAALQNMSQGLAMFDQADTLIVCNQHYAELYRIPPHLTAIGTPRELIVAHRRQVRTDKVHDLPRQNLPGQQEILINELRDGRVISVKHCPMPGGGFVSTHEDVTEIRKAEAKIAYLAEHDPLTGLPNRAKFRAELEAMLRDGSEGDIAVLYIDLDRFKPVNDTLGHRIGDSLLRAVANRLAKVHQDGSVMARLGGDEFALIARVRDPSYPDALAQEIIDLIERPFDIDGHGVMIGASVGVAISPQHGSSADELTGNADLALYAAKAAGRGVHRQFQPDMGLQMRSRRDMESDLRTALALGEFELHYQPLVSVSDQRLRCFEALLRWRNPKRGLVPPNDFISVAEEIGLICDIGRWVLFEACRCAASWPDDIRVAVNLSVAQFKDPDLLSVVSQALLLSGLPGDRLELEITESILLQEAEKTVEILHKFRSMGIRIAMDDFGTGYSSLNYLRLFPFDKLKIDRAFVKEIGEREDCAAIVRAATSLARSLNMVATAEGVETEHQLALIGQEGCTEAQGYLFSRPIPQRDLEEFLSERVRERAA